MAGEHRLERVGDLADRGARPARVDRQREQVAVAAPGRLGQCREGIAALLRIADLLDPIKPRDLGPTYRIVVDIENVDMIRLLRLVFVDPDNDLFPAIDRRLTARRGFLDAQFRHAALDRSGHAAQCLDLLDQVHRRLGDRMGQALDVVAAAERIDDMRDAAFLGEDQLGVAGDLGRGRGRQAQRLVEGIGVQ